ncbi:serine/threonine protein kinase [Pedobacter sp. GR22-6]|uniref:serine/threonine protein kinase n=1 Tax=Pedobacter sp. GR22-6 TaxID=3127957 RepID=UPI00307D0D4D
MIGTIIDGKYEVLASKGAGGFGQVFQVKEIATEEMKALKICTSSDPDHLRRFAREVRLMTGVSHQNVVKLLDLNLTAQPFYFTMELAKGTLESYLPRLIKDHLFALRAFLLVCEGVKAIHIAGQFHRDIKPSNVLVLNNNVVVVSDLGLGVFEARDSTILTSSNIYMGTEGYIPPEYKIPGGTKNADRRGDVYQLGKMLYNILTGENPILINDSILPPSLTYIIRKATKDRPDDRYQSVDELIDAINNYMASLNLEAHPMKAFEAYITAATDLAKRGSYDETLIASLISSLKAGEKDIKQFFDMFDKIPYDLVTKMVSDFSSQSKEVLHYYDANLETYLGEYSKSFEYAEKIADLMSAVYYGSNDIEVKTNALRNILKAGWYFNRYYTMGVFDSILTKIKDDAEAKNVAKMLHEEAKAFVDRIDQLPYADLHVEIRNVIDVYKVQPTASASGDLDFDSI